MHIYEGMYSCMYTPEMLVYMCTHQNTDRHTHAHKHTYVYATETPAVGSGALKSLGLNFKELLQSGTCMYMCTYVYEYMYIQMVVFVHMYTYRYMYVYMQLCLYVT